MLSASVGGFTSSIRGAGSSLKGLGSVVTDISSKIFSLAGAITGIAGAGAFTLLVKNSMESIAATGRLSDRLGISTEKLGGLQYAATLAGVGSEELSGGLEKMLHGLGEAASGSGEAAVGIAHMGLSAQKLANESPDQAFTDIADGLKSIQNPAERTAVTMQIFGKSGASLLPLLLQGAEGIKAAQAEAEKLGITFNRVDAAKVESANQSMRRMQAVFDGAVNTLAIELAPFIDAVAGKLANLGSSGRGAGGFVTIGFNAVLSTLANVADFLSIVEAGWQLLRSGASYAIGGIIDGLAYVLDGLDWLLKKLGQAATGWGKSGHQVAAAFYDTGHEAFQKAGEDFDEFARGKNSKAAARFMQDIQDSSNKAATAIAADAAKMNGSAASTEDWAKKLQKAADDAKKVVEILADLHKEIDTFGLTDGQKKAFELKGLGATPEQLAQAKKLADTLDQLTNGKKAADSIKDLEKELRQLDFTDAQKKLDDLKLPGVSPEALARVKALGEQLDNAKEGKSIFDATRTPMELYENQIGKLSKLLGAGAISWDTYGRGIRAARSELEKTAAAKSPELLDAGSAAADRYIYQQRNAKAFDFTTGAQKQSANKDELEKLQYNEQFQSRLILQRIENKLTDSNAVPTQTVEIA